MELVNTTPLPAKLDVAYLDRSMYRVGMIVAKATYNFDAHGHVTMETDDPYPIYLKDVETELGLLPRDDLPRTDEAFEVILLGAAHAPQNEVREMIVSLQVGEIRRELLVFGDREWVDTGGEKNISEPVPFTRMPLTYGNAFGGTSEIWIDRESSIDISEPLNRAGKGMDPSQFLEQIKEMLTTPEGYPWYSGKRELPNIEDPQNRITKWDDRPLPKCWATVPFDSALHAQRGIDFPEDTELLDFSVQVKEGIFHRAHPDWVIDIPPAGVEIMMEGLTPSGNVGFNLPLLRVMFDYIVGERTGTRELRPQMLVLLPEKMRFYLVYKYVFPFEPEYEEERSLRLRIEEGWITD